MKRFSLKRFGALSSALALMVTLNGCARNFSSKGLPVESNTTTTEDTLIEDTLVEDTLANGEKTEVEQKTYLAKDLYVYKAKQAIKCIIDEGYPTPWETEAYNTNRRLLYLT